jgi:hypothetical protein
MLRYVRERHLELLKERLAALPPADSPAGSAGSAAVRVDPEWREELMHRLMVRHLTRVRSGRPVDPREVADTLGAYLACCDSTDLRQVDVVHSAYEVLWNSPELSEVLREFWMGYSTLLRAHLSAVTEGQTLAYRVHSGRLKAIEPATAPLHVLILADNFISGSRIWEGVAGDAARVRLKLLFCNNAQKPAVTFWLALLSSLGFLLGRGRVGLGLSMLHSWRASARPLGHPDNTAWLQAGAFDLGIHNMGVIYGGETIAAFKRGILNAHIGYLPGMRGRSVFEWSLVYGVEPCISTFFVDEGIDTGALIVDRYFPPADTVFTAPSLAEARRRLFHLDGLCYCRAISRLLDGGQAIRNEPVGQRFYLMSELLAGALIHA